MRPGIWIIENKFSYGGGSGRWFPMPLRMYTNKPAAEECIGRLKAQGVLGELRVVLYVRSLEKNNG